MASSGIKLFSRVEACLEEYKSLFGDLEPLNLPDDILLAQTELEKVSSPRDRIKLNQLKLEKLKGQLTLTSHQRLTAYNEHVDDVAKKRQVGGDLAELTLLETTVDTESNRKKSRLEILAEERDYKRRRQSYKGGKAAGSRKSYTETIRDVIETQSDMLRSMNSTEQCCVKEELK